MDKNLLELLKKADSSDLNRALLAAALAKQSQDGPKLPFDEVARILTDRNAALQVHHEFQVGLIVKWKSGLKNRRTPEYDQPAVVVELLENPIFAKEESSGSTYFREPMDVILGILDSDGDFVVFHYDRRRFEPFSKPAQ